MKAEEVGYRIAQARKKQGMTQRELSERLHVSDKAVSKWERGVNYPDISLFDEIAKTLDLSLVELLGIEDRSKEEIVQALFVTAGIGKVIAENASIAGASGGCQAEIGSASAMAAGAVIYRRRKENMR